MAVAVLLLAAAVIAMTAAGCQLYDSLGNLLAVNLGALAFYALGLVIILYRPGNRIGWLCSVGGVGLTASNFVDLYVACVAEGYFSLPGASILAWLANPLGTVMVSSLFVLLPALYPDGRFLSPRWRRVIWGALITTAVAATLVSLSPGPIWTLSGASWSLQNPFAQDWLPLAWKLPLTRLFFVALIGGSLLGIASMALRLWRSTGDERQQMKWFTYFLVTAVAVQLIFFELLGGLFYPWILETFWYAVIIAVVFTGLPLTIGIALFKYRLYDIDIIIRRTLQYTALTGILALLYFGGIVLLQSVFRSVTGQADSPLITVITTLGIAALFTPLRRRIQDAVDRRFYREKYDAARTLTTFARTARDEVELDALTAELVRVVQETMQPDTVSLWFNEEG